MRVRTNIDYADETIRKDGTEPADLHAVGELLIALAESEKLGERGADYRIDRLDVEVTF